MENTGILNPLQRRVTDSFIRKGVKRSNNNLAKRAYGLAVFTAKFWPLFVLVVCSLIVLIVYIVSAANMNAESLADGYTIMNANKTNSKQNFEKQLLFVNDTDAGLKTVVQGDSALEDAVEEDVVSATQNVANTTYIDGKTLTVPTPGTVITYSVGIDKPNLSGAVSSYQCWTREYNLSSCVSKFGSKAACTKRLQYAIDHIPNNNASPSEVPSNAPDGTKGDTLIFDMDINGKAEKVFAGAMVDGFANVGDVVECTYEDGVFYFLILDVKSYKHKYSELGSGATGQVENLGHCICLSGGSIQLSICEFIGTNGSNWASAKFTGSGQFLTNKNVLSAKVVAHYEIDSNLNLWK